MMRQPGYKIDVALQVEFVIAFIGVTLARAVAAPLNPNYTEVGGSPLPDFGKWRLRASTGARQLIVVAATRQDGLLPQDEYGFYMEDAASKLLLVPATGSKHAEAAASKLSVPVASMQLRHQGDLPACSCFDISAERRHPLMAFGCACDLQGPGCTCMLQRLTTQHVG